MNFYDTLGVPRDASPDDIRKAYRKLARKHHPDLNKDDGVEARFKELGAAYECLNDPERRARYDADGDDAAHVPIEQGARDVLKQVIAGAISNEADDYLAEARRILGEYRVNLDLQRTTLVRKLERAMAKSGQVRVKSGDENLVQDLLEQEMQQLRKALRQNERSTLVHAAAVRTLAGYVDDGLPPLAFTPDPQVH